MNALPQMLDEALGIVTREGGHIAVAGALPRNLPQWVSESQVFRFIPENGHVAPSCRLLLVGRFLSHSMETRLRKEACRSVPGFVKFGILNKLLDKYKPTRERVLPVAVPQAPTTTPTPEPAMSTRTPEPTGSFPKPRRGECVALVDLYKDQILERYDRQEPGPSIARWLIMRAKEQGFRPSHATLLRLVYSTVNAPKLDRTEGQRLLTKAEELQQAPPERTSVSVDELLPAAPAVVTPTTPVPSKTSVDVCQLAPSVAEALEALSRSLSGVIELDRENQRLRAENAALKEKLEKLKAALS